MMIQERKYIKPADVTVTFPPTLWPLCASDAIPVKTSEEGDQSTADSRRDHHPFSLWDEEADDE